MITPYHVTRPIDPFHVSALDIETDPDGDVIGVGFAWDDAATGRQYRAYEGWGAWFDDVRAIYKVADKVTRERLRTIYAHNGLGFDWLSLVEWMRDTDNMERMELLTSGSFGIGCDVKLKDCSLHLRDSLRLLPASLADLSRTFGVTNAKIDLAGEMPHTLKARNPRRFWAYLRNDVFALQETIKAFWQRIVSHYGNIGMLPLTLPALAMRLWRMTLREPILVPWNAEVKQLERRAYTGGRTECYQAGKADVRVYDANSLYPTVMASVKVPVGAGGGWTFAYDGYDGLYELTYIQTNQTVKPVLRDETTNDFTYVGSGVYCKPEIDLLLEMGGTISVMRGFVFDRMAYLFRDFIEDAYHARLEAKRHGDDALSYVYKILMNSLYGKFGQKEIGEKIVYWDTAKMDEELEKGTVFYEKGDFCIVEEVRNSETTFVSIAAYITSEARVRLYRQMAAAQLLGGTLWATDTDSIHVSGVTMSEGDGLGEWKLEYQGKAVYLGKKLNAKENGKITAKGIGKDGKDTLTYADFERLLTPGSALPVTFHTPPTSRQMAAGEKACKFRAQVRTIRATSPMAAD